MTVSVNKDMGPEWCLGGWGKIDKKKLVISCGATEQFAVRVYGCSICYNSFLGVHFFAFLKVASKSKCCKYDNMIEYLIDI